MRWQVVAISYALVACGPSATPKAPSRAPGLPEDAVFEVMEATGKTFVVLGPASTAPTSRAAPVVIGHGLAIEIADEEPLADPLSFTLVGRRGACTSSAASMVKISGGGAWLEAVRLDGCRGDPAEERLALAGSVADARFLEPEETLTADGEPIPTSGFYEGSLDGKLMERKATFTGLELVFEQRYREPHEGAIATRVRTAEKVLSAMYAHVDGAVRAGPRWLFLVTTDTGQRGVMELMADLLVPRLGAAPRSAPLSDDVGAERPPAESPKLTSKPAAELSGTVSAARAPAGSAKPRLFLVESLRESAGKLAVSLADDKGERHELELSWPEGLVAPFAKGQRVRLSSSAPNRGRASVVCEAENGELLLAIDAPKLDVWKVTRGPNYSRESKPGTKREFYAVNFENGDVKVESRAQWVTMETTMGTYYVYGDAAKAARAPLEYAIVRAR
ncbi:MAG: hypothetical protein R3B13_31985 [Polyangiaceae bacterium]